MTIWKLGRLLAALLLVGAGCGSAEQPDAKATAPKPAPPSASTNSLAARTSPTEAQPKLRTIKLWLGQEELITEIAVRPKEIETGMMHRKSMEENEAMLFIMPYVHQVSFWMRNTLVPLSCGYIDPEGNLLEIYDMKPLDETPIPAKSDKIRYVLEVKQGWFQRHNIQPGTKVRTEAGTLQKTFFR
jgi:uncharacterized protein